ncbi:hypothetical protein PAPHI01_2363 [Pancytospora philotis]|nr:hypothetical protein PAPHI01_2363 [Pancytospora philotis]
MIAILYCIAIAVFAALPSVPFGGVSLTKKVSLSMGFSRPRMARSVDEVILHPPIDSVFGGYYGALASPTLPGCIHLRRTREHPVDLKYSFNMDYHDTTTLRSAMPPINIAEVAGVVGTAFEKVGSLLCCCGKKKSKKKDDPKRDSEAYRPSISAADGPQLLAVENLHPTDASAPQTAEPAPTDEHCQHCAGVDKSTQVCPEELANPAIAVEGAPSTSAHPINA